MNIYSLPSLIAFTVNFSVAFTILLNNPRSKLNRWFFSFVFVFAVWNLTEILILNTSSYSNAILGAQILYRVIFLIPAFFVAIAYNFPRHTNKIAERFEFYVFLFAVPVLFLALSFPDFRIDIVNVSNSPKTYFYRLEFTNDFFFIFQMIITIAYLIWGGIVLILKIPKLRIVRQKNVTIFFTIGFFIIVAFFFLMNIFRSALEDAISFYFLSTVYTLTVSLFFLYVNLHYKGFKARNVISTGLAYSTIYTFILATYFIIVLNLSQTLNKVFKINSFFFSAIIILVLVSLIRPLEKKIQNLLDKLFRQDLEEYRHNLSLFIPEIQNYIPPKEFFDRVKNFIRRNFLVGDIIIFLKNEKGDFFNFEDRGEVVPAPVAKKLGAELLGFNRAIEIYELDLTKIEREELDFLEKKRFDVILPMIFENEILGVFLLRKKNYAKKTTEEKLERLTILSAEITISYNRNKMFESLQRRREEQFRLEKLASLGEMTAGVAHEIRNPLNTISISAETLRSGSISNEEREELLGYISNEVERLDNLLKDFLKLSRQKEIREEEIPLDEVFNKLLDALEAENGNNIKISTEVEKGFRFYSDKNILYQILLNLGLNALDAVVEKCNENDGFNCPDGQIIYSAEKNEGEIIIKVTNNGKEIPDENIEKIFDPFFTTKDEGTGLGLSIVKNLTESLGGRIEVFSSKKVTEFYIILQQK